MRLLRDAPDTELLLGRSEALVQIFLVSLGGRQRLLDRLLFDFCLFELLITVVKFALEVFDLLRRVIIVALERLLLLKPRAHLGDVFLFPIEKPTDFLGTCHNMPAKRELGKLKA